jgi:hypothetical protein
MQHVQLIVSSSKGLARPRADSLGLKIAVDLIRGIMPSEAEITELDETLTGSLGLADHDISVCALAAALRAAGRSTDSAELLRRYYALRRETYEPPHFLSNLFTPRDASANESTRRSYGHG